MSTHNICFPGEIRKILCGYPLLSVAMSIFRISLQKHPCRYSLEAPWRDDFNKYPKHTFSWRNNKKIGRESPLSGAVEMVSS